MRTQRRSSAHHTLRTVRVFGWAIALMWVQSCQRGPSPEAVIQPQDESPSQLEAEECFQKEWLAARDRLLSLTWESQVVEFGMMAQRCQATQAGILRVLRSESR